tara:strand:+ start:17895 stop:20669 length:2775 start_codon:yes stop_codon:yes gene_type:complete
MTHKVSKDALYLVDGSAYIFRAYHALPPMTRKDGTPIGAVLGFTNMFVKLLKEFDAGAVAVIFDAARKNFRNEIYEDYKANRDDPPEDLIPQFPLIREATEAFGLPALELEGYEADDLIATYTKLAEKEGREVVIVSSDKDLMQLIRPGVCMLDPMKGTLMGEDDVMKKFGVTPDKVIDVQALTGDSIDNVPGVPGIGVKTAALLINEYGDLETLLERAEEIKQNKRRESLIEYADQARISKKLVTLDANVVLPITIEGLSLENPFTEKLTAFLEEQGFKSVIARLGQEVSKSDNTDESTGDAPAPLEFPSISDNKYICIDTEEALIEWIERANQSPQIAIDTETTSLTPAKADLIGISAAITPGEAIYIPLGHGQGETDLFGNGGDSDIKQIAKDKALALLKPLLEDESILKIGQNIKYDLQLFMKHGIAVKNMDDTMLLSYVLDGSSHSHGMDNLSKMYLDHTPIPYKDVVGTGKSQIGFDAVPIEKATAYAAEDADITLRLWHILKPRLAQEKMVRVYEDIERPLIPVIAEMELNGIKIDRAILKEMSTRFGKRLVELEGEIHKLAGHEFNVASPKQLGVVLFEEMGLEGGKKTKSGDWSTSADILEKLASNKNEFAEKILEYRQLSKLKSTYTDALQDQINHTTGRVHTSFHMTGTSTGRLSSSDPNIQNIPIRTQEGREIRTAFVAEDGCVLLSIDYSQIELRLAAILADIKKLKQAFQNGDDIHAATASEVFDVPMSEMTSDIRRKAKAINFGIIYGISAWGLARQLDIEASEASEYIKAYFARFPELANYMEEKKQEARDKGYVQTYFGRKCFADGIHDKNQARRSFAERAAINAPLQGTAADIMKLAMHKIFKALKEKKLDTKLLLQVHDELILEVPEEEVDTVTALVKDIMESVVRFDIPLIAEAGTAHSWAEAH